MGILPCEEVDFHQELTHGLNMASPVIWATVGPELYIHAQYDIYILYILCI